MPRCESCGNDYDKSFQVIAGGKSHTFDSFECAIQALAPKCQHCGVHIVGHGLEKDGRMFCCHHCAPARGCDRVARPRLTGATNLRVGKGSSRYDLDAFDGTPALQ